MTDDQHTLAVPIVQFLTEGMPVFDRGGKKVGHVRAYNVAAGYMVVEGGALRQREYYIPLTDVLTIDPREIYLGISEEQLAKDDAAPPKVTAVREQLDESDGGPSAAVWHEVLSGYGEGTVTVDPVDIGKVASELRIGMTVLDVLDAYVGEITQVDASRAVMVIKHTYAGPPAMVISYDAVATVNGNEEVVKLLRSRESLLEENGAQRSTTGTSPDAARPDAEQS